MKKRLSPCFRTIASMFLVGTFAVVVAGQAAPFSGRESETEIFVRVLGWIVLSGAGITHIVTNVWSVWRGKEYDQLKEAASNYKELCASRAAQLAEAKAELLELRTANEKLTEKILRS